MLSLRRPTEYPQVEESSDPDPDPRMSVGSWYFGRIRIDHQVILEMY